jgi:hypothetical protein
LSDLKVTTISDLAGTGPVTLTKQSAAKIFCNFTMVTTTAIRDSLNCSSITDTGVGEATINFTSSMGQTYFHGLYITNAFGNSTGFQSKESGGLVSRTASSVDCNAYGNAYVDAFYNDVVAFGDLA